MRVFSVFGVSKSGKTTTIEHLIRELRRRGYAVGSVKDIHAEGFALDTPGTNTHRHKRAGADPVTARGLHETDIMFDRRLDIGEILRFYGGCDFVVLEGVSEAGIPAVLTAHDGGDLAERLTPYVFAVSGRGAAGIGEYNGIPAISAVDAAADLADLVERKVYRRQPMNIKDCCGLCGFDCETLGRRMLAGESPPDACLLEKRVALTVNGREIEMVGFVQKLLKNAVLGVAKELRGYEKGQIRVTFTDTDTDFIDTGETGE